MCNCKGWDIAFWPDDEITVEPHFCRVLGDCGHTDNTLEEAADQVADEYKRILDWHLKNPADCYNREKTRWIEAQEHAWRNHTHADYHFYKNQVDIP